MTLTTLDTIVAELNRQLDAYRGHGLGCFDGSEPKRALIDGHVDLEALAAAIDATFLRPVDVDPQPIETAPKMTALLLSPEAGPWEAGHFNTAFGKWVSGWDHRVLTPQPVWWTELPPIPGLREKKE